MAAYCHTLTTNQVRNVLIDEAKRINRIGDERSEVRKAAITLYHEAREECIRHGIEPDDVLRENGIARPCI